MIRQLSCAHSTKFPATKFHKKSEFQLKLSNSPTNSAKNPLDRGRLARLRDLPAFVTWLMGE